jgi:SAM-dependent methyltransferase
MRRFLEAGCGRGEFVMERLAPRGAAIGVDVMPRFIADARRTARKRGLKNCRFAVMYLERLRFPRSTFDEVHTYHVLEHVVNYPKSLSELARVLKPGGRLCLAVPHYRMERILARLDSSYFSPRMHRRAFIPRDLRADVEQAGLTVVRMRNRGSLRALGKFVRFLAGMPFEDQSGRVTKKNAFVSALSYLDFVVASPIPELRHDLAGRGRSALFAPFLLLKVVLFPVNALLNLLLPNEISIEAVKRGK